jgi:hypothetical protein
MHVDAWRIVQHAFCLACPGWLTLSQGACACSKAERRKKSASSTARRLKRARHSRL